MALETQLLYEFGDFRLNPADHSLLSGGKPISLTPKSFEILVALIESNGRLVTKDELMKKIWPDSFVEEANLTVNVSTLRRALGDTAEHQQYIETVPKLGYRFIAPVTELRNGGRPEIPVVPAMAPSEPLGPEPEPSTRSEEGSPMHSSVRCRRWSRPARSSGRCRTASRAEDTPR